jgi:hypothetical protein
LLDSMTHYFFLESPMMGGSTGVKRQLFLYTGVVSGTAAKWLFDLVSGASSGSAPLLLGFIASIVIFPAIYEEAGLNRSRADFVKWCVAFQNGFFWVALLDTIGKTVR